MGIRHGNPNVIPNRIRMRIHLSTNKQNETLGLAVGLAVTGCDIIKAQMILNPPASSE